MRFRSHHHRHCRHPHHHLHLHHFLTDRPFHTFPFFVPSPLPHLKSWSLLLQHQMFIHHSGLAYFRFNGFLQVRISLVR